MVATLPFLFAQAAQQTANDAPSALQFSLAVMAMLATALVLPFVLGHYIAKSLRMNDYNWKIGVVLCSITCSAVIMAPKPAYLGVGWPPKLGIDLNGGAILVYKVNLEDAGSAKDPNAPGDGRKSDVRIEDVVEAIARRINPDGLKETVVRPFGRDHIEIIVPEVDKLEVDRIKRSIETAGQLEFMIVANSLDHEFVIQQAKAQAESADPKLALQNKVLGDDGKPIGTWVGVARDEASDEFKVNVSRWTIRNPKTGEIIDPASLAASGGTRFEDQLKSRGIQNVEVLMVANDKRHTVTGADLGMVNSSFDTNSLSPIVQFALRSGDAANRMGLLTGDNLSEKGDNGFKRHLAIVLDGRVLSAPSIEGVIQEHGQITGRFSQEEVEFLVRILRSGKLPAALDKAPVSDNIIDPLLGLDTIVQGSWSIVISLVAVVGFMLVYYRFSGVIACLALTVNLVMIVALMVLVKAPFTLPGLAGMVLTVGMSVDANVLIYERMREEIAKGAALRMTIRNGFDRAFTTIVDSNITTLITAAILYVIGTDQVRGFAVTLFLGILISMFTAIFCSRVLFDIAERQRWLTELRMMRFFGETNFDFMSHWKSFTMASVVVIAIGLVATVYRGEGMFDIDFLGGTSVEPVLKEEMGTEEVRSLLTKGFGDKKIQFSLTSVRVADERAADLKGRVFKIDTSIPKVTELQVALNEALQKDGKSLMANYSLDFTPPKVVETKALVAPNAEKSTETPPAKNETSKPDTKPTTQETPAPTPEKPAAKPEGSNASPAEAKPEDKKPEDKKPEDTDSEKPSSEKSSRSFRFSDQLLAFAEDAEAAAKKDEPKTASDAAPASKAETPKTDEKTSEEAKADDKKPAPENKSVADVKQVTEEKPATAPKTTESNPSNVNVAEPKKDAPGASPLMVESTLTFSSAINATTLKEQLENVAASLGIPQPTPQLSLANVNEVSGKAYPEWVVRMSVNEADASSMLKHLQDNLQKTPVFLSSSEIGGAVANNAKSSAIYAILASLVGIVLYIWIRFQSFVWGLAAVLALVHDVLMMLAAIAISKWLEPALGFMLVEEFKINLVIIAAFLTLVGYSINDTIVVFDRIREVRGKSPKITREIINLSINQTLSRTILTALTTFMVVVILYFMGGPSIRGFSFSLVVGVFVGTYSSVFIAAPVMLWMTNADETARSSSSSEGKKVSVNDR